MRALIALACWLALSVPLALIVSRVLHGAERSGDVAEEAEDWLRHAAAPPGGRLGHALIRAVLMVVVVAPVVAAGAVAAWRLPDAVTVARADGQLVLSWPPGQPDETTSTTALAVPTEAATAPAAVSVESSAPTSHAAGVEPAPADDGVPPQPSSPPSTAPPADPEPTADPAEAPAPADEQEREGPDPDDEPADGCDDRRERAGEPPSTTTSSTTTTTEPDDERACDEGDDDDEPAVGEQPTKGEQPPQPTPTRSSWALLSGIR